MGGNPRTGKLLWSFRIADSTCKENVCKYFDDLFYAAQCLPGKLCIVLDNHKAHTTPEVFSKAHDGGALLLFTPPYSCALNNVEHVWSVVKRFFARAVAAEKEQVTPKRFAEILFSCCEEAGDSLTMRILTCTDKFMRKVDEGELV